jgi:hypothetical protein
VISPSGRGVDRVAGLIEGRKKDASHRKVRILPLVLVVAMVSMITGYALW